MFTGCRLGDGPFVRYLLRDKGLWHQISQATATAQHIRPCFGLGWTIDTSNDDLDQWNWVSYFTLFASEVGGSGSSPFAYTLDGAIGQANFYDPAGGNGVIWSGTQGMTLDQAAK
jgi:CubicO group peptidase (beta-lactamase class C family)